MASINAVLTAENGDDLYPETYDDYVLDSNGEALSTRLGSRSEASGVSGTSAFAKINTLNSDLANKIQMVKLHTANTITIALTNGTGVIPWSVLDLCDRTKYDYLPMASCNGFFLGLSYRFTGDGFTVAGNDQTYSGNVSLQVFALACAK